MTTSLEEEKPSDLNEVVTDEEKMERILKGTRKDINVQLAANKLTVLLKSIPEDVIKPYFLKANRNLNSTHKTGKQDKLKVDIDEILNQDEWQASESSDRLTDKSDLRMTNETEKGILRILYALSSEKINILSVSKLMSLIKLLSIKLGLNENDSFAIKNMANSLIWKSREMPISELCTLLSFSYKRKLKSNNNKIALLLFEETLKNAERRWVEIVNAKEFASLVHYYPAQISEQFMRKLESRITDFIENMDATELATVSKLFI